MGDIRQLREVLIENGAAAVGFAALDALPPENRGGLPVGIAFGIPWDKDVLLGIGDGPTPAYKANYDRLNEQLDALGALTQRWLSERGYKARAQTRAEVGDYDAEFRTGWPHKTVCTLAGLGWIGKCALLITPDFGAALRISSVLTDAPLPTADPIRKSRCGSCTVCAEICPGKTVSGKLWEAGMEREAFWDAKRCHDTMLARSPRTLGYADHICGLCVLRCPWTQKYLRENDNGR